MMNKKSEYLSHFFDKIEIDITYKCVW